MKIKFLLVSGLLILTFVTTACGTPTEAASPEPKTQEPYVQEPDVDDSRPEAVSDLDSLKETLLSAGVSVEPGEGSAQDFFSVPGQLIQINGVYLQVYEFQTAEAMSSDASQVSDDGSSIGTYKVTWIEPPHFFRAGRMIVLCVDQDQATLDLLEETMGPQFAGR